MLDMGITRRSTEFRLFVRPIFALLADRFPYSRGSYCMIGGAEACLSLHPPLPPDTTPRGGGAHTIAFAAGGGGQTISWTFERSKNLKSKQVYVSRRTSFVFVSVIFVSQFSPCSVFFRINRRAENNHGHGGGATRAIRCQSMSSVMARYYYEYWTPTVTAHK